MKRLYIHLFHGRVHPGERLEDWGFEGPLVGPIDYFQVTYKGVQRYEYERSDLGAKNALAFNATPINETKDVEFVDDMFKFEGFYFGDFSIATYSDQEAKVHNTEWFKKKLQLLSEQLQYERQLAANSLAERLHGAVE